MARLRIPEIISRCAAIALFCASLAASSCGPLADIIQSTAEPIDPNFNFDSDGRKVAGGCDLPGQYECYQYSNMEGYGEGGTDYFNSNCVNTHSGTWIPAGCPTTGAYGWCEKNYVTNYWVRHYFYVGHTMTYTEIVDLCTIWNGLRWRDYQ